MPNPYEYNELAGTIEEQITIEEANDLGVNIDLDNN